MRDILFRGKRTDNGKWAYGLLCRVGDTYANIRRMDAGFLYSVLTNTIGQYIGLTDNSGKKVFEGDIVKGCWSTVFEVYFDEDYLQYRADGCSREIDYYGESDKLKVIGNIHDNPELLEGKP